MRLIDADLLKKNIAKWLQGGDPQETVMVELDDILVSVIMEIEEQPTAFDVEKVVEQLEEASHWEEPTFDEDGYCNDDSWEVVYLDKAMEIVKSSGCI